MSYKALQEQATKITQGQVNSFSRHMMDQYRQAMLEINKKISALYDTIPDVLSKDDYFVFLSKGNRLFKQLSQIEQIYVKYSKIANVDITQASRVSFVNEFYRRQYVNSWFTPVGNQAIVLEFAFIDPVAVELSVFGTQERWAKIADEARKERLARFIPKGDKPTLRNLIVKNDRLALRRIRDTVTQGIIIGRSNQEMASDIKNTFGRIGRNAERIVRTETHRNLSGAQFANRLLMQDQGVNARRQILSTLDARTRAQSAAVDGLIDNVDGFFTYPGGVLVSYPGNSGVARWDINDRETTIELIDGVGPQFRAGVNPITGEIEVAKFDDFYAWAEQNGIGRNKYGEYIGRPKTTAER